MVDQHQVGGTGLRGQQGLRLGWGAAGQHLHAGQRLLQRQRQAFAEQRVVVDQQQVQGGRRRAVVAGLAGSGRHRRCGKQQRRDPVGCQGLAVPAPAFTVRSQRLCAQAGQHLAAGSRLER